MGFIVDVDVTCIATVGYRMVRMKINKQTYMVTNTLHFM